MSAVKDDVVGRQLVDPFAAPAPGVPPSRPRLLAHVGRWGRARRWLPPDALRILDVGCSFGYGTAALAARAPMGREVVGVERDPDHLEKARARYPWVRVMSGDANSLPVADGTADAVLLLDVIEHMARPERALTEAARVVRPGGVVIVSVPHRGLLSWLDALNLYTSVRRRWPSLPPLDAATERGGPHRHFTASELADLLGPSFTVERVARTGLGTQELVTTAMIVVGVVLRARFLIGVLMPVHLIVGTLDDLFPVGRLAYNLAMRARRRET